MASPHLSLRARRSNLTVSASLRAQRSNLVFLVTYTGRTPDVHRNATRLPRRLRLLAMTTKIASAAFALTLRYNTLPGFMMPSGSSAALMLRIMSSSSRVL